MRPAILRTPRHLLVALTALAVLLAVIWLDAFWGTSFDRRLLAGAATVVAMIAVAEATRRWHEAEERQRAARAEHEAGDEVLRAAVSDSQRLATERGAEADKFEALLEQTSGGIVLREGERFLPTFVNAAAQRMLGVAPGELSQYLSGEKSWQPLDADGKPVSPEEWPPVGARRSGGRIDGTYGFRQASGEVTWQDVHSVPFAWPGGEGSRAVLTSSSDVTARRAVEEALWTLSLVAARTRDLVVITNHSGQVEWVNEAFIREMGYTQQEMAGRTPLEAIHGEDVEGLPNADAIARAVQEGLPFTGEVATRRRDGSAIWLELGLTPVVEAGGDVSRYVMIAREIGARRQMELALRDGEARYRELTERSRDIVVRAGPDYRMTYVSPRARDVLGWSPDEMVGRDMLDFMHPEDAERTRVLRRAAVTPGTMDVPSIVYRARHRDGHYVVIDSNPSMQFDERGHLTGLVTTLRDVTERQRIEEQLRQASKMQAVATLAGGVAHDFNNLLTVIDGNAEFLASELPMSATVLGDIDRIREAVGTGRTITRQLLAFTRQNVAKVAEWRIDPLLQELAPMLQRALRGAQSLQLTCGAAGAVIEIDHAELELALLNLVSNARDAMAEDGRVRLTSDVVALAGREAASLTLAPGDYVRLRVADDGRGFSPEASRHLFEPFFTTKPLGHGAGLGLPTVYSVVHRAKGEVRIESEAGKGSIITMWLPCVMHASRTALGSNDAAATVAPHGAFTVLLVDDEPEVRRLVERQLRHWGYDVQAVGSGSEALALIDAAATPVDLILVDYAMPGMTGSAMLAEVATLGVQCPTILMSGFTGDDEAREALQRTATRFLEKPYDSRDLRAMLEELLPGK